MGFEQALTGELLPKGLSREETNQVLRLLEAYEIVNEPQTEMDDTYFFIGDVSDVAQQQIASKVGELFGDHFNVSIVDKILPDDTSSTMLLVAPPIQQ